MKSFLTAFFLCVFFHQGKHSYKILFYSFGTYTMHVQVYIKDYMSISLKKIGFHIHCSVPCIFTYYSLNIILYPHIMYHNDLTNSILIDI